MLIMFILVGINLGISKGSEIPVTVTDPVYGFLRRMETRAMLSAYNDAVLPLSRSYIAACLQQIQQHEPSLSTLERKILKEFLADYRMELTEQRHPDLDSYQSVAHPFQNWSVFNKRLFAIFDRKPEQEAKHLVVFEEGKNFIWADFAALVRSETKNNATRVVNADQYFLQGDWARHFAYAMYAARYRRSWNPAFDDKFLEERNTWGMYQPDSLYTYDLNFTALIYYNTFLKLGLYNQPVLWGYSQQHNLILSANPPVFPYIGMQAQIKSIRFSFLHADLLNDSTQFRSAPAAVRNRSKYLAVQRVDIPFWRGKLWLGYSGMVVYGDRNKELAYLIPVNFFWITGHVQQDRDNSLMAFDCKVKLFPNATLYGTILFDELRFSELGRHWWANKYGLQGGVRWATNLFTLPINLNCEFTAVRPWVYTHKTLTTNYTNNSFCLGFPYGANAQVFFIEGNAYLTSRLNFALSYSHIRQGCDENGTYYGGDVTINYEQRDHLYDHATKWLMGPIRTTRRIYGRLDYELFNDSHLTSELMIIDSSFKHKRTCDTFLTLGLQIDI